MDTIVLPDWTHGLLASPTVTKIRPTHYLTVHQSAIRALAWIQAPPCDPSGTPCLTESPSVIASGGYDGVECLTDIREGRGSIMNRTRGTYSHTRPTSYTLTISRAQM